MRIKMSILGLGIAVLLVMGASAQAEWNGPWPDTGQTKCYDNDSEISCPQQGEPFYGQDAQHQGPPRSYTKLGHGGVELPDNALHVDEGGEWIMTRDNVTGLIWEIKTAANKHDKYDWQDAQDIFVGGLNASSFGGFGDWRLPTVKELSTLVNASIPSPGPTIDTVWLPRTVSSVYWSSTTYADNTGRAWLVYFSLGYVGRNYKSYSYYVRAVRAGQSGSLDNLVINGDGTVTDAQTRLMWQMETAPGTYDWEEALSYVQTLNGENYLGYSDWRLPEKNELQSLVDYSQYYPSIDPLLRTDTMSDFYWSSTTYAGDKSGAWIVDFYDGCVLDFEKFNSYLLFVRAVRSVEDQTQSVFSVTFKDHDGTVLKTEEVEHGGSATAPADPVREGYTFTGWDVAFDSVTSDFTVTCHRTLFL